MKSLKLLFAAMFAVALMTGPGFATEDSHAKCCAEAKKAGKECAHPCCVQAAKDGETCEKCPPADDEKPS